jgi:hypothetical protein
VITFFFYPIIRRSAKQDIKRIYLKYERTKVYWLNWAENTIHVKQFDEQVTRSALVLKLLTFKKNRCSSGCTDHFSAGDHWRGKKLGLPVFAG